MGIEKDDRAEPSVGSGPELGTGLHRANPLQVAVDAVKMTGGFVALLAVGSVRSFLEGDALRIALAAVVVLGLFVCCLVACVMSWRARTWELADDALVLRHGVVSRREIQIPYGHIHTVQVESGVLERLLGLVTLDFDTGAPDSEGEGAVIRGLREGEAQTLKDELFRRRGEELGPRSVEGAGEKRAVPAGEKAVSPETPTAVYELSGRELVLAALSRMSVATQAAALVVLLVQGVNKLQEWQVIDIVGAGDELARTPAAVLVGAVVALLVGALALGAAVSFALNLARLAGWRAERFEGRLVVERGLLSRRSSVVALERIQSVSVRQGIVRQLMGYAEVRACVVAAVSLDEGSPADGVVLHPFLRLRDLEGFLACVVPEYAGVREAATLRGLPAAALRRAAVRAARRVVVAVGVGAAALAGAASLAGDAMRGFVPVAVVAGAVLALVFLAAGLLGARRFWRESRCGWTRRHLVLVRGGLSRVCSLVSRSRIQHVSVCANPFQARQGVATVELRTAAPASAEDLGLRDLASDDADALLDWLRPRPRKSRGGRW